MRAVDDYFNYILNRLKADFQYELNVYSGKEEVLFTGKHGLHFVVYIFPLWQDDPSLSIEHQCDPDDVRTQYCDGDLFYLSDMSKEEMYEAMLKEIEND